MKKVLLADDDESTHQSMFWLIENELKDGYDFRKCFSGEEAIEAIKSGYRPDVALLDYDMGKEKDKNTGIDVTNLIRKKGLDTKVLICTGKEIEDKARDAGADYVRKPADPDYILDYIRKVC